MTDFKFSTLEYHRPDFKKLETIAEEMTERVQKAASYEEVKQIMKEMEDHNCR